MQVDLDLGHLERISEVNVHAVDFIRKNNFAVVILPGPGQTQFGLVLAKEHEPTWFNPANRGRMGFRQASVL